MKKYYIFILIIFIYLITPTFLSINSVHAASSKGKIHFINVGQSDAILVESNGKYLLIDASRPIEHIDPRTNKRDPDYSPKTPNESVTHVIEYIKGLGIKNLDYIIGTHNHLDHIGGMQKIAESGLVSSKTKYIYRKYVVTTEDEKWDFLENRGYYDKAINSMKAKGASLVDITDKKKTFEVGNFTIKLLNTESWSKKGKSGIPTSENYNSIVEYITIGQKKILLTSDMYKFDETRLVKNKSIGEVDILKLGHHGLHTSTDYSFVDATKPKDVIITGDASENEKFKSKNIPAIRYIKKKYTDKVYITSKVQNAIVVDFTSDSSYTIKDADGGKISNALMTLNESKAGLLTKITGENSSQTALYYFSDNLKAKTGWNTVGNNDYYFVPNECGAAKIGLKQIDGITYYFNGEGQLKTGWVSVNDKKADGNPPTDKLRYFNPNGKLGSDKGKLMTGKLVIGDKEYYLSPTKTNSYAMGQKMVGFVKRDDKWYYYLRTNDTNVEANLGSLNQKSTRTIGGKDFTFNNSHVCTNFTGFASKPSNSSACKSLSYNGASQTLTKDITGVSYVGNKQTNTGTYQVTAKPASKYLWSNYTSSDVNLSCAISPVSLRGASISAVSDKEYTGSAITPTSIVTVSLNGNTKTLTKDNDYSVTYANNTKVGTATYKITGKGNFTGTKSTTFKIVDSGLIIKNTTNMCVKDNRLYIKLNGSNYMNRTTLMNNIKNNNTKKIYNRKNSEVTSSSSAIATGFKVTTVSKNYPIVIYGDVDGNGTINANDLALSYRYLVNQSAISLDDLSKSAADMDESGTFNSTDISKMYLKIVSD